MQKGQLQKGSSLNRRESAFKLSAIEVICQNAAVTGVLSRVVGDAKPKLSADTTWMLWAGAVKSTSATRSARPCQKPSGAGSGVGLFNAKSRDMARGQLTWHGARSNDLLGVRSSGYLAW